MQEGIQLLGARMVLSRHPRSVECVIHWLLVIELFHQIRKNVVENLLVFVIIKVNVCNAIVRS